MKLSIAILASLLLAASFCAAEDQGKDNPNKGAQPDANAQGGGPGGGRGRGPGGPGGQGGRGGPGGQGGPGAMMGQIFDFNMGQGVRILNDVTSMVSRMLGINADELRKEVSPDQLPLAASSRFVLRVPVGGIENFDTSNNGWKMEGVFKMSPEQVKSVDTLRDEYKAEQKKLGQEIFAEELKLAQKVADLRAKYEQKANEILSPADKEAKQKMDALSMEIQMKNWKELAEAAALYDISDLVQNQDIQTQLRDKSTAAYKDGANRMQTIVTADGRAAIIDALKKAAEDDQQNNPIQRRGRGGPGGAGARGGPAAEETPVAPPKAPEGDKF